MPASLVRSAVSREATVQLLAAIRSGDADASPAAVAKMLDGRASAAHRVGCDLSRGRRNRRSNNLELSLHAVTSVTTLHFEYENTSSDFHRLVVAPGGFIPDPFPR